MTAEPRVRVEARPRQGARQSARKSASHAVSLVVSDDWAIALARLQQLRKQGHEMIRLCEDEHGRVRVEPVGTALTVSV